MSIPAAGQIVHVRSRQYLVEHVSPPPRPGDSTLLRLACVEDDAQGEPLEVLWEKEVDARQVGATSWEAVAGRGFDEPRLFSAYLHALRWNCVTSTDPRLLQSPYRAGIEVKAYQLEPLRKALLMPRVNLFIADDVGLGKTIEAGLILRELLMRQKVRRTVICCPPSVVRQWKDEMEQRFGLSFVIHDREHVAAMRQQRDCGVNPWTPHVRSVISHALQPALTKLRELHPEMDRAVLDAYGWTDIPTAFEFLLDYEIDEETWANKKKPYRYRWPDDIHDEVLARLLELNRVRAEEERLSGLAVRESPALNDATPKPKRTKKHNARATPSAPLLPGMGNDDGGRDA